MHFPQLTIGKNDDPKGRTFTVHYVASIQAPKLYPSPGNTLRPVLLAYAGSSSAVRAFTANLRCGLVAATMDRRYELLRSFGHRYQVMSPVPGQSLVIAYLPDLFHLHPGVQDHDALQFVSAPPVWWLDCQERLLAPDFGADARDLALAMAFVARLDARTSLPIANDPGFHRALFQEVLAQPWACSQQNHQLLSFDGLDALGLAPPVLCDVPQKQFADFLASITAKHLSRHHSPRARLAPLPRATQLTLNFLTA